MHFRSQKKTAGDVSLSAALDIDSEGNGLYLMDVVSQEEDMAERVSSMELCRSLRGYISEVLDSREAEIIRLRYGIGGGIPKTQRETAQICGISRSYVSRRHSCKRCPETLANTGVSGHRSAWGSAAAVSGIVARAFLQSKDRQRKRGYTVFLLTGTCISESHWLSSSLFQTPSM